MRMTFYFEIASLLQYNNLIVLYDNTFAVYLASEYNQFIVSSIVLMLYLAAYVTVYLILRNCNSIGRFEQQKDYFVL